MFDPDKVTPEIWEHIIKFLQRTPPPAYHRATWKDLHQQDLTTVSRVSTLFHELTVPHLYTSVVVNELPLLLASIERPLASLDTKITPKADRLALVKHLRISALGPTWDAEWTIHDLLEKGNWSDVAEDDEERTRRILELGDEEILRLVRFLHAMPYEWTPMEQLKAIVIGQAHNKIWELYERSFPDFRKTDGAALFPLASLIARHPVTHICVYETLGPYGSFPDICERTPIRTYTYHHVQLSRRPLFLIGGKTRHIYNGADAFLFGLTADSTAGHADFCGWNQLDGLMALMRQTPNPAPIMAELIDKTRIEIYGLFSCLSLRRTFALRDVASGAPSKLRENAEEAITFAAGFEERLLQEASGKDDVPDCWKGRIKCLPVRDTPCCEACGWNPRADSLLPTEWMAEWRMHEWISA